MSDFPYPNMRQLFVQRHIRRSELWEQIKANGPFMIVEFGCLVPLQFVGLHRWN